MGSQRLIQLALLLLFWVSFTILCSTLPIQLSITDLDRDNDLASEEQVLKIFEQWREKHRKVYKHAEEEEERFQNFWRNLKFVIENNFLKKGESNTGHVVGLNKFADLSNEEFKEAYLSKLLRRHNVHKELRNVEVGKVESCEAPSSLDWRKYGVVTGIKDQGDCGSCWAFSSTGAMEGINAIRTSDLIRLSEQELMDCDTTNYGCDGGLMDYAFAWVVSNGGIDSEANYPYLGVDATCNATKEERKVVSIDGYEDVNPTESALFCAVVQQPVSVGMDGSALDFQLYVEGIYDGTCSDNPDDIDHAVLIVGYGSEGGEDYWIIKNSWGTEWGMEGYGYIRRNTSAAYGVCAINAEASYPTKESSTPSPFPAPTATPPPPPPTPPPPSPPSPSPSQCGDFAYCPTDETCCCILDLLDTCFLYGCCEYENAVCCTGTEYCCPQDYPICDVDEGLCLQSAEDGFGVPVKNRKLARHKLPWTKMEETGKPYQSFQWKRNRFAAIR